ncbi:hypothetical protein DVQ84_07515 [Yersinia enterocolitica]|nr:hypothetical protein [Yersinia enterocolitica]EKN6031087.1 hypothetical protein [Yersinia enterocolitica]EKN6069522.1 hypothetical protein [Yersinia enterocolitica]EKN6185475.1 hypothetical protein [Yersinia enterocolitica]EKN6188668.1 hypothetical protein [Yersinia enterocolitica]
MELIMNINKFLFHTMILLSFCVFCFITFVVFSFSTTLTDIYDEGGLNPFNYGYVVGHLLILMFGLGCFYFSIKTTLRLKDKS